MKKLILPVLVVFVLLFSAYAVAAVNDDVSWSFSSVLEEGISGHMMVKVQQVYYATSQQFFNSNIDHISGFSQQMQHSQNMQTRQAPQNMHDMRQQHGMNGLSNIPSDQNDPMGSVPRMQQEMMDREDFMAQLQKSALYITDAAELKEYVTPYTDAVQDYLDDEDLDDEDEIYEAAVSWIWVSDTVLNGQQEEWLTPSEFLEETPDYDSNPVSCEIASDCEEQANTLASLLIGSGVYDESEVRVAIGLVNFDGSTGGHAWVEVYEDGEWFPVDATVGPYYDSKRSKMVYPEDYEDIDFYYFQNEDYSVIELWYYYNNEYYLDMSSGTGDAPDSWNDTPSSYR